jgi:hypothetical protein
VLILRKYDTIFDEDYLSFDTTIDGESRHGSFTDGSQLSLDDGTPEFWAKFIAWFLARLPAGSRVRRAGIRRRTRVSLPTTESHARAGRGVFPEPRGVRAGVT